MDFYHTRWSGQVPTEGQVLHNFVITSKTTFLIKMARKSKRNSNYRNVSKSSGMWKGISLTLIVVVALFFIGSMFFSASNTGVPTDKNGNVVVSGSFCSDNPTKSLKLRISDELSSTGAYINGSTVYITDLNSGATTEATITGGTTGSFTTVKTDVKCGAPEGYEVSLKATGDYSSADKLVITPEELASSVTILEKTMSATLYSPIKVKVYDEDAKAKAYDSTNSTDYVTSLTSTFYSATGSTGWTIGTDGSLDLTFTFAPNTSAETKGEAMYIAIDLADDSNIDDWDEDSLQITYDGVTLSAVSLSENELKALSSYEKVFKVENPVGMKGGVKDTETDLRLQLQSGDGINPDFDPVVKIVALGDYKSTKSDTVLEGIGFQDNSARTELYSAQTFTIAVN